MIRRRAVAAAAAVLLSGCGHSPEPVFLTVDRSPPGPATARSSATARRIRVGAVHLPPSLDRPQLVRRAGPGRVTVDEFARWAAPLDALLQRALTQDLRDRLPEGSVTPPRAPPDDLAATLTLDVVTLGEEDGSLRLEGRWTIVPPDGPPARTTVGELRLDEPLSDGAPATVALALARLAGRVADRVAASLP